MTLKIKALCLSLILLLNISSCKSNADTPVLISAESPSETERFRLTGINVTNPASEINYEMYINKYYTLLETEMTYTEENKTVTLIPTSNNTSLMGSLGFGGACSEFAPDLPFLYSFALPFSVEGDNIDSVTYSIDNSLLVAVTFNDENYITSFEPPSVPFSETGWLEIIRKTEDGDYLSSRVYCKSFTIDYDRFTDCKHFILVKNLERNNNENIEDVFIKDYNLFMMPSDYNYEYHAMNMALNGVKLTCSILFDDGTEMTLESLLYCYADSNCQTPAVALAFDKAKYDLK